MENLVYTLVYTFEFIRYMYKDRLGLHDNVKNNIFK